MSGSGYPLAQIFQACLPIKYYNVWWSAGHRQPSESQLSGLRGITSPEPMWKINRGAARPPNTSSGYLSPLELLCSAAWALSLITLPAAAILKRAIQISCPKMVNNYLFIGRWGEEGGSGQCRGPCWWIGALVKRYSRKQLTQEYPFTRLPPWDARTTRVQAWPRRTEQTSRERNADNWQRGLTGRQLSPQQEHSGPFSTELFHPLGTVTETQKHYINIWCDKIINYNMVAFKHFRTGGK